ncbi:MAG: hypothetical protein CMP60_02755 [Flavobacteriales bacterium]|nr:hypothetical protein [Flavobacteriales bacterium]
MIIIYFSRMKFSSFLVSFFCIYSVSSQSKSELYINQYSELAINEMKEFGIPASITLSQGILESGNGESYLATEGKNHFGIKCHGWEGEEIYADDDKENECFRKYKKVQQSYRDHSEFLTLNRRYAALFELEITNYKGWAKGLKKAGYATSTTYAEKLISIIERYNLQEFDQEEKDESLREKHLFVTHNYGFPFAYGVGLNYMQMDKYFINTDVSSSFVFSGVSVGGGKHLFNKFYAAMSVNGIYHGFTNNDKYKLDIGINPKLTYVLDKKNKIILINTGFLYTFQEIKDKNMIVNLGLTYLIK